jgi:hypothetical protein
MQLVLSFGLGGGLSSLALMLDSFPLSGLVQLALSFSLGSRSSGGSGGGSLSSFSLMLNTFLLLPMLEFLNFMDFFICMRHLSLEVFGVEFFFFAINDFHFCLWKIFSLESA